MAKCGDGFVQNYVEECDDGNVENLDGCTSKCTDEYFFGPFPPVYHCGDGIMYDNEECDDGNTEAGDGCDETCRNENLSTIAIIGIVVGALASITILVGVIYLTFRSTNKE